MDKIFKNDTIMGIVAIATLALVVVMFVKTKSMQTSIAAVQTKLAAADTAA